MRCPSIGSEALRTLARLHIAVANGLDGSVCLSDGEVRRGPHPVFEMAHKRKRFAQRRGWREVWVVWRLPHVVWRMHLNSNPAAARLRCVRFCVFLREICPIGVAHAAHNAAVAVGVER